MRSPEYCDLAGTEGSSYRLNGSGLQFAKEMACEYIEKWYVEDRASKRIVAGDGGEV